MGTKKVHGKKEKPPLQSFLPLEKPPFSLPQRLTASFSICLLSSFFSVREKSQAFRAFYPKSEGERSMGLKVGGYPEEKSSIKEPFFIFLPFSFRNVSRVQLQRRERRDVVPSPGPSPFTQTQQPGDPGRDTIFIIGRRRWRWRCRSGHECSRRRFFKSDGRKWRRKSRCGRQQRRRRSRSRRNDASGSRFTTSEIRRGRATPAYKSRRVGRSGRRKNVPRQGM